PQGSGTYNYDRLVGMTYPTRPETGARSLWEIGGHYTYFDEIGAVFRCKLRRSARQPAVHTSGHRRPVPPRGAVTRAHAGQQLQVDHGTNLR
ncbi:MAG TPA: hypothetical protein PLL20_21335, partial [Phycisphaerae bacterium]|nr:hypothetical protein [Phycisphaerae bacterium]HRR84855.1 hypothetical protein [Phycisphaerae bacterium]